MTTIKHIHQEYLNNKTAEVAVFIDNLKDNAVKSGTFDSAAAMDFIDTASNQNTGTKIPEKLQVLLDSVDSKDSARITKALLDSVSVYESQHGIEAPADVIEQAIHSAYATTDTVRRQHKLPTLDSADSNHHDQISLQPNRAVVAILSAMGDAIPFAHYLPADIGSNEGILAIMSHRAGDTFGRYSEGGSLDGINSGDSYVTSSRINSSLPDSGTGAVTGALTTIQDTDDTCAGGSTVKLLRGRSIVYVNGIPAAKEVDSSGTGASAVSGTINVAGTDYAIGGTINTDTGVYALTTTPKLPDTIPVVVEGFIDFERAPELTPSIVTAVNTFRLYAKPWRVTTYQTMDSRTQIANELGLDAYSEGVISVQTQFANERHYEVLRKGKRIAVNNQATFDFDWDARSQQLNKSQIMIDLASALGAVSQQMAIDTMDHGLTHIYVGKNLAAIIQGMPREVFEPSGIAERPCIFRLGRLFGRYEVYYTPKVVTETSGASQILGFGRATSVPMNPFVLGDAVPPTVLPLALNADLKQGAAFYARNFTSVNPFQQAALGCALINITNMP
ncbi:MAG: hypothetical protein K2Q13_10175 [Nitrosomonas sp.]|uniref:hypothetical protein n=1 Tax=Nitrosomonas sp. TaxID=42353 RepID=UPI0025F1EE74|nr:hypothetical protein [Nitrosomonas sp.]MBY0475408.1 hypothetical protein [Nitrosomonas sp.]